MHDAQVPITQSGLKRWIVNTLRDRGLGIAFYCATLLLSAFLLFSVEPMFAKMVLPRLGGSPSVWAVSLCFFQAALLAGYCYAHALNRFLTPLQGVLTHLLALAVAWLMLPVALSETASAPSAEGATFWLLGILTMGVGVPFVVVSASAPLLQSWFARSGHPHAGNPYFLYGASNLGSLLALLAYPVAVEPVFGLSMQSMIWTSGFVVLAALMALCAATMLATPAAVRTASGTTAAITDAKAVTWADRAVWVMLSFVPSGLLVAFTTYLTTDIASAPFLWVIPLAVFLTTFILVFRDEPPSLYPALATAHPWIVAFAGVALTQLSAFGWVWSSSLGLLAFFTTAMVCHRVLYERRPGAAHVTEFYLWMSVGGVLGGIFAAIIAPLIFSTIFEYPLLLVAGLAMRPAVLRLKPNLVVWTQPVFLVGASLVVFAAIAYAVNAGVLPRDNMIRTAGVVIPAAIIILSSANQARQIAMGAIMLLALALLPFGIAVDTTQRSFFGVLRVTSSEDGQHRLLIHGITLHGAQRIKTANGDAVTAAVPATYYHPAGPMARGLGLARTGYGADKPGFSVGIIGLGTGAIAAHARPGDTWDFFEIDPLVAAIAKDPRYFTYLSTHLPNAPIKIGDARLMLAREPSAKYDYLLVDAFSSDAIPVHLLTVEALRLYLDRVADDGVLALHISNRHLDLAPIIARTLTGVKIAGAVYVAAPAVGGSGFDALASQVILIARTPAMLERLRALEYAVPLVATPGQGWTDDYTNVLAAIWSRYVK